MAVFLRNIHFLVKMPPLENHKPRGFPVENPKPSFIGESKDQPTRSHGSVEKSKTHPVFAGTSSPGWPLENVNIFHEFMHIYICILYVFTKVSFWK